MYMFFFYFYEALYVYFMILAWDYSDNVPFSHLNCTEGTKLYIYIYEVYTPNCKKNYTRFVQESHNYTYIALRIRIAVVVKL